MGARRDDCICSPYTYKHFASELAEDRKKVLSLSPPVPISCQSLAIQKGQEQSLPETLHSCHTYEAEGRMHEIINSDEGEQANSPQNMSVYLSVIDPEWAMVALSTGSTHPSGLRLIDPVSHQGVVSAWSFPSFNSGKLVCGVQPWFLEG